MNKPSSTVGWAFILIGFLLAIGFFVFVSIVVVTTTDFKTLLYSYLALVAGAVSFMVGMRIVGNRYNTHST